MVGGRNSEEKGLFSSPTKMQSKIALMVKDYQLKVSINVLVTGAVSYFHSISIASYFVDPIFRIESVVAPSCHR